MHSYNEDITFQYELTMKPAIIIPAYSRPHSLLRLLNSIERAQYPSNDIRIVISLDGGASDEVNAITRQFKFSNGTVSVVTREENMGLREHILWCGDQSLKYGSVIILEDDLIVDPYFYLYAVAALDFYKESQDVAGIALYSPRFNEFIGLPFEPMWAGYSTYFMRVTCSWGQAWSSTQWREFRDWYDPSHRLELERCEQLPEAVRKWPESSWKKYFSLYLVSSNKFFVYPYLAYSTNCSDLGGTHIKQGTNKFQVPMPKLERPFEPFNFQSFMDDSIVYDSFMEPIISKGVNEFGLNFSDIEFDCYGSKPVNILSRKNYCLTSKKPIKSIESYPLQFHPIEQNLLYGNKNPALGPLYLCSSEDTVQENFLQRIERFFRLVEYYSPLSYSYKILIYVHLAVLNMKIQKYF